MCLALVGCRGLCLDRHFQKEYPARLKSVRWLAFIAQPTPQAWEVTAMKTPSPQATLLSHDCHNGHASHLGERFGLV